MRRDGEGARRAGAAALRLRALPVLLALAGCGSLEARLAREPDGFLVGRNIRDVIHVVGTPVHYTRIWDTRGPEYETLEVEWDFANSDTAFGLTVPFVGVSLQVGGAGKCTLMATVARLGGKVLHIALPQAHVDGLEPDTAACEPLLAEAARHPSASEMPPDFDAFTLADPASNLNTGAVPVRAARPGLGS